MPEGPVKVLNGYAETLVLRPFLTKRQDGSDRTEIVVRIVTEDGRRGISMPLSEIEALAAWCRELNQWRAIEEFKRVNFRRRGRTISNPKDVGEVSPQVLEALSALRRLGVEANVCGYKLTRIDLNVDGERLIYYATTGRIVGHPATGLDALINLIKTMRTK